jgi:hypothetical protein
MLLVLPSLSKKIYDPGTTDYGGQEVLEKSVMLPKKEFLSYVTIYQVQINVRLSMSKHTGNICLRFILKSTIPFIHFPNECKYLILPKSYENPLY